MIWIILLLVIAAGVGSLLVARWTRRVRRVRDSRVSALRAQKKALEKGFSLMRRGLAQALNDFQMGRLHDPTGSIDPSLLMVDPLAQPALKQHAAQMLRWYEEQEEQLAPAWDIYERASVGFSQRHRQTKALDEAEAQLQVLKRRLEEMQVVCKQIDLEGQRELLTRHEQQVLVPRVDLVYAVAITRFYERSKAELDGYRIREDVRAALDDLLVQYDQQTLHEDDWERGRAIADSLCRKAKAIFTEQQTHWERLDALTKSSTPFEESLRAVRDTIASFFAEGYQPTAQTIEGVMRPIEHGYEVFQLALANQSWEPGHYEAALDSLRTQLQALHTHHVQVWEIYEQRRVVPKVGEQGTSTLRDTFVAHLHVLDRRLPVLERQRSVDAQDELWRSMLDEMRDLTRRAKEFKEKMLTPFYGVQGGWKDEERLQRLSDELRSLTHELLKKNEQAGGALNSVMRPLTGKHPVYVPPT